MRYLVYDEYVNENESYEVKRTEQEVLEYMRKHVEERHGFRYKNSQDALDDYIAVNWAYWKEEL